MKKDMVVKKSNIPKSSWAQKSEIQKRIFVLLVVGPSFAAYLILTLFPNILTVYYSFLEWDGFSKPKFVGFFNILEMIKDKFMWNALYHNLIMLLVIPLFTIVISVFGADLLVTRGFKENGFYKVLFFFPNVLSTVILGLMWAFIYDGQFGLLNAMLNLIGIDIGQYYWLGNGKMALVAVMLPIIWVGVGFYLIIFMNAMRSIPKSLYESAVLDGITNIKRLFFITLPLISGIIRIGVIFIVTSVFKNFEMILVLTAGGPGGATNVVGLYMFSYAFGSNYSGGNNGSNYGYSSAIGMMIFIILVGGKFLVDKVFNKEPIEY